MNTTAFTRALLAKVQGAPWMPRFRTGTIVDVDPTPMVTLAGDADPIPANSLGDPGGVGETVWAVQYGNTCLVIGRAGGTRLYGEATRAINQTGITTQTALTGLSVDVVVTQPGRVLHILGQVQALADTSGDIVIGSVQQDGVDVGRFGRFRAAAANDAQLMSGFARVEDLDPGGYVFRLTLERTGSGTVTASNATTPGIISVQDAGAVQ